jgi:hypothetical protein
MEGRVKRLSGVARAIALLVAVMLFVPSETWAQQRPPSPATFRLGSHADRAAQGGALNQPGGDKFEGWDGDEYDEVEDALQEICPCLFIRVVTPTVFRDARGRRQPQLGEIIIRHPDDVADLDQQVRRRRSGDPPQSMRDNFCDCYSKHRAGCNLLWRIAMSGQPVTIWEVETDDDDTSRQGNVHRQGHVGFNLGSNKGGERGGTSTRRPRSVGLAHELAHASHFIGGSPPPNRMDREFNASRAENQVRKELREAEEAKRNPNEELIRQLGTRTEYDGQRIPNPEGVDIPLTDLFECDKEARIAPPGGGEDPVRAPDNQGGTRTRDEREIGRACPPAEGWLAETSVQHPRPADAASAAILDHHNTLRAQYGSPPLKWNPELAGRASDYARVLAESGQIVHASRDGRQNERENISLSPRGTNSPLALVRRWGDERRYFRGGTFPNSCTGDWSQCAHFTQMVWSTTTDVGCGFHRGAQFDALVCRYSPPGNRDGRPVISSVTSSTAVPCPPELKASGRPERGRR